MNEIHKKFQFCTKVDHHYLPQLLALYDSLCRTGTPFILNVLTLSERCEEQLLGLSFDRMRIVPLQELLWHQPGLIEARKNRSLIEFYFSCTASLLNLLLGKVDDGELVTYLDADTYIFGDFELAFQLLHEASIGIAPHRFHAKLQDREKYGKFNMGWVSLRRDPEGIACAKKWAELCVDWCYERLEDEKFADQKYLNSWPKQYKSVKILEHPGLNCAPWNVEGAKLFSKGEKIQISGAPLIQYHFHGLKWIDSNLFKANLERYIQKIPTGLSAIYIRYLQAMVSMCQKYLPSYQPDWVRRDYERSSQNIDKFCKKNKVWVRFSESNSRVAFRNPVFEIQS